MLDIAIIGAGLCGLTLARQLQQRGQQNFAVFEARERTGGRIAALTHEGVRHDVGATWFWPDSEPNITRLIAELHLLDFAQYDQGAVLTLRDPDKAPTLASTQPVHSGARRLVNGMVSLMDALARTVPGQQLHFQHQLIAVFDREDHVELHFARQQTVVRILARRVVLAMPPRLAEQISFTPPLPASLQADLQATPTWMAAQAKCVVIQDSPLWRQQGLSGNAFVDHDQATCNEVFDACDHTGKKAALAGFIALSPLQRRDYATGLNILIDSQMRQLFGTALQSRAELVMDWASEPYTCSALDLQQCHVQIEAAQTARANHLAPPVTPAPIFGRTSLQQAWWQDKLFFGGTESMPGNGHMEGAVSAAQRLVIQLPGFINSTQQATTADLPTALEGDALNAGSVQRLQRWVQQQPEQSFALYRQHLNYALATQQQEQLTQRAMLHAMEQLFASALQELQQLPFSTHNVLVECGRCSLTPQIQLCFKDSMQRLLDSVIAFNRASAALAEFPFEQQLPGDYLQTILRDLAAVWHEFSIAANALLLGKCSMANNPGRVKAGEHHEYH